MAFVYCGFRWGLYLDKALLVRMKCVLSNLSCSCCASCCFLLRSFLHLKCSDLMRFYMAFSLDKVLPREELWIVVGGGGGAEVI